MTAEDKKSMVNFDFFNSVGQASNFEKNWSSQERKLMGIPSDWGMLASF